MRIYQCVSVPTIKQSIKECTKSHKLTELTNRTKAITEPKEQTNRTRVKTLFRLSDEYELKALIRFQWSTFVCSGSFKDTLKWFSIYYI